MNHAKCLFRGSNMFAVSGVSTLFYIKGWSASDVIKDGPPLSFNELTESKVCFEPLCRMNPCLPLVLMQHQT